MPTVSIIKRVRTARKNDTLIATWQMPGMEPEGTTDNCQAVGRHAGHVALGSTCVLITR